MKISDIIISDRLRSIDEKKVAELAKSIEEIGLINPVSINTNLQKLLEKILMNLVMKKEKHGRQKLYGLYIQNEICILY